MNSSSAETTGLAEAELLKLPLDELADRILPFLLRFAADPELASVQRPPEKPIVSFFQPRAGRLGRYLGVAYVNYHGDCKLSRAQAVAYLLWLEAGNVGKHFKVPGNDALG